MLPRISAASIASVNRQPNTAPYTNCMSALVFLGLTIVGLSPAVAYMQIRARLGLDCPYTAAALDAVGEGLRHWHPLVLAVSSDPRALQHPRRPAWAG